MKRFTEWKQKILFNIFFEILGKRNRWFSGKKNLPANARDTGSIPGSGRSPGVVNGNALQYSYLENSMDRGAWRVMVHEVTKSWT